MTRAVWASLDKAPASNRIQGESRFSDVRTKMPQWLCSKARDSSPSQRLPWGISRDDSHGEGRSRTSGSQLSKASAALWLRSPDQLIKICLGSIAPPDSIYTERIA